MSQTKLLGKVINVLPLGEELPHSKSATILKTERLEIIRLVMPAGKDGPTHTAPGEMTVHCLEGRVEFTVQEEPHELGPGDILHVPRNEPHSVRGLEDSSLLLTILLPKKRPKDEVQEASEESFPASDSPAWTGITGP